MIVAGPPSRATPEASRGHSVMSMLFRTFTDLSSVLVSLTL